MNVPAKPEEISQAKPEGYREVAIAQRGGGGALMPATFGDVVEFSKIMARSQHAIPAHLRDVPGACLAVTMQALRWELDPFAVASKSYNVKDMIAYEAQLIAAVVHVRAPITTRPEYAYTGEGEERRCTVSCKFDDGVERSYESPRIVDIKVKNSPLWKADPDQQLGYYSIRAFARRYCPEVILGVYTPEEAQEFRGPDHARDVTPRAASVPISRRISEIDRTEPENVSQDQVSETAAETSKAEDTGSVANPSPAGAAQSGEPVVEKSPPANPIKPFPGDQPKAESRK
jgi:hypothetical protein